VTGLLAVNWQNRPAVEREKRSGRVNAPGFRLVYLEILCKRDVSALR
jgi:hypothetical protein